MFVKPSELSVFFDAVDLSGMLQFMFGGRRGKHDQAVQVRAPPTDTLRRVLGQDNVISKYRFFAKVYKWVTVNLTYAWG